MQRFRDGLVSKAHRLSASLNSRLARNEKEEVRIRTSRNRPSNNLLTPEQSVKPQNRNPKPDVPEKYREKPEHLNPEKAVTSVTSQSCPGNHPVKIPTIMKVNSEKPDKIVIRILKGLAQIPAQETGR